MGAVAGFGRGGVKGACASLRDFLAALVALDPASTCPSAENRSAWRHARALRSTAPTYSFGRWELPVSAPLRFPHSLPPPHPGLLSGVWAGCPTGPDLGTGAGRCSGPFRVSDVSLNQGQGKRAQVCLVRRFGLW